MSVQKRGNTWRCKFSVNGKMTWFDCTNPKTGKAAETEKQARSIQELIRSRVRMDGTTSIKPAAPVTMLEVFDLYWERVQGTASEWRARLFGRELLERFKPDTDAETIDVWKYITWARQQPLRYWRGGQ